MECPVCLEEMKPPKKIFQCSNGHVICELCKNNPEVRSCPTCRVKFRGHNVVRNIVAEKLARSTYESDDMSDLSPPAPGTRTSTIESNPPGSSPAGAAMSFRSAVTSDQDQYHLVGFEPAYGYRRHTPQGQNEDDDEDDEDDNAFLEWARFIGDRPESGETGAAGQHREHRRLAEASGRDEFPGDSQPSNRDTPREFSGRYQFNSG